MNDQKIYECIALDGPQSAEALAQQLRADVDDVVEHLQALCAVNDLAMDEEGRYEFTRKFKHSEDCQRAKRRAAAVRLGRAGAGESITDRALNFMIASGGRCSSAELHQALELQDDQLPSVVLADALAAGQLFKEGKEWFVDRRITPRALPLNAGFMEDLAAPPKPASASRGPALFTSAFDPIESRATRMLTDEQISNTDE